jgi:hypothetical protein
MDNHRFDRLRMPCRHFQREDGTSAIPENISRWMTHCVQNRNSISSLLANLEILRLVPSASRITAAVVCDYPVFVSENIGHIRVKSGVPIAAWNHEERLTFSSHFVI